jgi:CHASE2 domain-containing sensor protein
MGGPQNGRLLGHDGGRANASGRSPSIVIASGFIVGYVTLWLLWGEVIGVALGRRDKSAMHLGLLRSAALLASLMPVLLLALVAFCTAWIRPAINEMLSLMTGPMLAVFVVGQLGRWRKPRGETGLPRTNP